MTDRPYCCYVDPNTGGCPNDATHEIADDGTGAPYTETHACASHVDALLPDCGSMVKRLPGAA